MRSQLKVNCYPQVYPQKIKHRKNTRCISYFYTVNLRDRIRINTKSFEFLNTNFRFKTLIFFVLIT